MTKRVLLLVDPQNDFCDLPVRRLNDYRPTLPISGAYMDMKRVAEFIRAQEPGFFDTVVVTLDSHPEVAIERPGFWKDERGNQPAPFTSVSLQDVKSGKFSPVDGSLLSDVLAYLDALEAAGKYEHRIWPDHCVDGQQGAAVVDVIAEALGSSSVGKVVYVKKGSNPLTEHYSAVKAEVPRADDPSTDVNQELVSIAQNCDELIVSGEASSHCVKATVEDLLEYALDGNASRVKLITNGMSPVYGCEKEHNAFIDKLLAAGAQAVEV